MRVMVIVKASPESEAGRMPGSDMLTEMGNYNEELIKAGIMLAGEGLASSAKGKRVKFSKDGKQKTVTDGPFAETKELVGGFWLWQVRSMEEAVEWLKRAPFRDAEVEIRVVHESTDFENFDPEMLKKEEAWREKSGYAEKR